MSQLATELLQLYSIGDSFYQRELTKLQRELNNFEENKFLAVIPLVIGFILGILFLYVLRLVVRLLQSAMRMIKYSENISSSSSTAVVELAKLPPLIPKHIAVIMDGNRRFGMEKHGDALQGHWAGGQTLVDFIQWCIQDGIGIATFFAFSTENWRRDPNEVQTLMAIFAKYAESLTTEATTRNVRVRVLSTDFEKLPVKVQDSIEVLERATAHCTGLLVNICLSYGSRAEILRACNAAVSEKHKAAMLKRKAARLSQQQQQMTDGYGNGHSNSNSNGHANGQKSRQKDRTGSSNSNGINNGHHSNLEQDSNTDITAANTKVASPINNGANGSRTNGHHELSSNQIDTRNAIEMGDKIGMGLATERLLLCGKCGLAKPLSSTRSPSKGANLMGNSSDNSSGSSSGSVATGQGLGVERRVGLQNGYEVRENGHGGHNNNNNNNNNNNSTAMCTCHSDTIDQDRLQKEEKEELGHSLSRSLFNPKKNGRYNEGGDDEEEEEDVEDDEELEIDEESLLRHMCTHGLPDPDLLIRTSGEFRISNFLLWQSAYTELFFVDKFWPDFNHADLRLVLQEFHDRQRRFGL